jgi:NADH-quinone oxidoreductase subunit N
VNAMNFPLLVQLMPRELAGLLPEIFLATGILLAMVSEFLPGGSRRGTLWFSALVALCSLGLSGIGPVPTDSAGFRFSPDVLTQFVRLYASLGALMAVVSLAGSDHWKTRAEAGEAAILVLSVALGAMLFASATNLVSVLLSLEFLSLCSYGLAGFRGRDARASEAGLKYVLYGGVASSVAVFGMSHVFGMTGSLDLGAIGQTLALGGPDATILVPLILVGVAFGYKLSLVPFHFWAPDVYQGAPAIVAGFLSTVPKAAGFAGLIHILLNLFPSWSPVLPGSALPVFLALFGSLSTLVGAVAAGMQKDARRLLAFSSVANAGTMLVVLSSWITSDAVAALGFFLLVYLFANFGAFLALDRLERHAGDSRLESFRGAWKRRPATVVALGLCLFSLAGIPPLAGFTAKWSLVREVLRSGIDGNLGWVSLLASAVVLGSALSLAWAYLGLVRATVVDDPETSETTSVSFLSGAVLALCAAGVVILGWGWPVLDLLRRHLAG